MESSKKKGKLNGKIYTASQNSFTRQIDTLTYMNTYTHSHKH